jgi:putative glutamine amidotransferase
MNSILNAGGIPIVLPLTEDDEVIAASIGRIDGLLLAGGVDIDPQLYGEEPLPGLGQVTPDRDVWELKLTREAMRRSIPIFAICRGSQMLNVAAGGTLYQDLASQKPGALQHSQKAPRDHLSHSVNAERDTLLHRIVGQERFTVNSFHHQAVKQLAPGFRATAWAADGVIEAYEQPDSPFVLGVQWHPENLARSREPARRLFAAFIEACS